MAGRWLDGSAQQKKKEKVTKLCLSSSEPVHAFPTSWWRSGQLVHQSSFRCRRLSERTAEPPRVGKISKINATLSQNNEQINNNRRSWRCTCRIYTVSMAVYMYTQALVWDGVGSVADSRNQQQQHKNSFFFVVRPLQNRKVNSCLFVFFFKKKLIFL